MLPDAIFIDTCIFEQERFNFKSSVFEALFEALKVKSHVHLLLPQITEKEILMHIQDWCYGLADGVWQAVQKHAHFREKFGMVNQRSSGLLGEELRQKYLKEWRSFQQRFKVQRLPYTDIATAAAMNSYFHGAPPFTGKKNKHEIPDALAFEALMPAVAKYGNIAVITKDKGMRAACRSNPSILHFMSLAQFTQLQLGEEEIVEALRTVLETEMIPVIRDAVLSDLKTFGFVTHVLSPLAEVAEDVSFRDVRFASGAIIGLGGRTFSASCFVMIEVEAEVSICDQLARYDEVLKEYFRPEIHAGNVVEWVPLEVIVKLALTEDRRHIDHLLQCEIPDGTLTLTLDPETFRKKSG